MIDNCLRITVGTDGQMDRLVEFLKKYLSDRRKKKLPIPMNGRPVFRQECF